MKNYPSKLSVRIPKGKYANADHTEGYIKEFDRINNLKPTPYSFRGKVVNG